VCCEAGGLSATPVLRSGKRVRQSGETSGSSCSEVSQSDISLFGARLFTFQPNSDTISGPSPHSSTPSSPITVDTDATTVAAVLAQCLRWLALALLVSCRLKYSWRSRDFSSNSVTSRAMVRCWELEDIRKKQLHELHNSQHHRLKRKLENVLVILDALPVHADLIVCILKPNCTSCRAQPPHIFIGRYK
jgi:hypothetical protein